MSENKDLTRWNRAGLSRFRYVDGNAVSYLEIIRKQLFSQFKNPESGLCEWLNPAENIPINEIEEKDENLTERQQRMNREKQRIEAMYHQDQRDWLWEISRSFSRASHILTEHADAYANERFLGTATEWDNVRKLVGMLDYHPAPPASAFTSLVIIAKHKEGDENNMALVEKGFQVVHTPTKGSKVIFETLEDLLIDPELNVLRLSGWNQSEDPAVPASLVSTMGQDRQFSAAANESVMNLQGVGSSYFVKLKNKGIFKIKDFHNLHLDNTLNLDINMTRLIEFKAKAIDIIDFELESDWSAIDDWKLPRIISESVTSLLSLTQESLGNIDILQQRIGMVSADLDQPLFEKLTLKDLLQPASYNESGSYPTGWVKPSKPEVMEDQVAMIMDKSQDKAEAVTIMKVSEIQFKEIQPEEIILDIDLLPSPLQNSWSSWKKNKLMLRYSSRWQRKCWLNGSDVIRTEEAHGVSADSHICWKVEGNWTFAKVIETDRRNLRLQIADELPEDDTELFIARALEGPNLPSNIEQEVALESGELVSNAAIVDIKPKDLVDEKITPQFPATEPSDSSIDILLAPIPSLFGKLPEVGSFIIPTPMLPMDLVKAAVKLLLKTGAMVIPSTGEFVFEFIEPDVLANTIYDLLNDSNVKWVDDKETVIEDIIQLLTEPDGPINLRPASEELVLFKKIAEEVLNKGPFLVVPKNPPVIGVVEHSQPLYMFDGKPDKVETGDWIIARFSDGNRALKVSAIEQFIDSDTSDSFSLEFEHTGDFQELLIYISSDFRGELSAEAATINTEQINPDQLELEKVPESLKVGRTVLFTCDDHEAVTAKVENIAGNVIKTSPPVGRDCSKGNLIIHGNVVVAGHGVSKPAKILGSGDATKSNQSFILAVNELSFTPNATMNSGVIAEIEVEVSGRIWQQVSSLKDSAPDDHHYAIRMTEDGFVKILFGDGVYGRRLPSGNNNVRVSYRVGSGLTGNVAAKGLEKPLKPHPLIDLIQQPLAAAGGGDMEEVTSLRENAPPSVLTLERAVSLSDFSYLAAAQSSVWQAKAFSEVIHGGRMECVKVVIVPAGGEVSPAINKTIESFLQKLATPGVQVSVLSFVKQRFRLKVTVSVNQDAFVAEQVVAEVTTSLLDHFTLKNRKLGEHLYLSEVYKIIEAVKGVENSICVLNEDNSLQRITAPNKTTVVYLYTETDLTAAELVINSEEFKP